MYAYDPSADRWSFVTSLPTPRYPMSAGVINGVIYTFGGGGGDGNRPGILEAYDPSTGTWSAKTPMPDWREFVGVGVVNGMFYVAGGFSAGALNTMEAYVP